MDGQVTTSFDFKTPSRQGEYARVVPLFPKAIAVLSELLESRNPMVRLGASNTIVDRVVPKLRSVEIGGELATDGTKRPIQVFINMGRGFMPPDRAILAAPASGNAGDTGTLQDNNLAPESQEDIHSNIGDTKTGT